MSFDGRSFLSTRVNGLGRRHNSTPRCCDTNQTIVLERDGPQMKSHPGLLVWDRVAAITTSSVAGSVNSGLFQSVNPP